MLWASRSLASQPPRHLCRRGGLLRDQRARAHRLPLCAENLQRRRAGPRSFRARRADAGNACALYDQRTARRAALQAAVRRRCPDRPRLECESIRGRAKFVARRGRGASTAARSRPGANPQLSDQQRAGGVVRPTLHPALPARDLPAEPSDGRARRGRGGFVGHYRCESRGLWPAGCCRGQGRCGKAIGLCRRRAAQCGRHSRDGLSWTRERALVDAQ